jgi:hypothetical protein
MLGRELGVRAAYAYMADAGGETFQQRIPVGLQLGGGQFVGDLAILS